MECVICKHGTTRSGFVTVTLDRDNCIVILKQVPADICQNCGEYYLSESVKWKFESDQLAAAINLLLNWMNFGQGVGM